MEAMPNLTTKELSAIEDQLELEQVLIKKYTAMTTQCTDPVLQAKCSEIAAKHQTHYNTLLNYLK